MTTPAAANLYLAQHLLEVEGRAVAIYNPNNRPLEELPVIYGFNNGGKPGWFEALLISQDGVCLGSHLCSDEAYMPWDLGILEGSNRHEEFEKEYPNGYRMEFVSSESIENHEGLRKAIKLAKKNNERP